MGYVEDLQTTRTQIAAQLVEITASPKPSYSVNGQSVQWSAHFQSLTDQLAKINALIAQGEVADGPVEIVSQGYT